MADQVEEIKSKTDIIALISEYVDLKKSGRNYKALCPFHSEKTPSFMVSSELQIFKCFGCDAKGDAISFLQQYEGMDFYDALKFLADKAGIKLESLKFDQKNDNERLLQVNSAARYFYSWILLNHHAGRIALDYLIKSRNLTLDTIKTFQLGYSPEVPNALKKFLIDKKKLNREDLEKSGLTYLKGNEVVDRFRGRVIFPLFDHRGKSIGFAGRILPKDENKDLAKYINTPETPIYHKSDVLYGLNITKQEIKRTKVGVVMEGELDLISSWQAGIKNNVAIKGSSLTGEQLRLLSRFTSKIILALDADVAGDDAARRGISLAENLGFDVRIVQLAGFKDPDEAARKDPDKLKDAIKSAKGVWDYLMDSAFERYKKDPENAPAKVSKELVPVIASISDKIVQAHYAGVLARKLGVPVEAVVQQIEKTTTIKEGIIPRLEIAKPISKSRNELLEERLLILAFRHDPKILTEKAVKVLINTSLSKRITEEYLSYIKKHKNFDPSLFAADLPTELVGGFTDILLKDTKGLEDYGQENYEHEINLVKNELRILDIKKNLEDLAGKIKNLEFEKKKNELKKVEKEFGEMTKKLNELEEKNFRGIIL